MPFTSSRDGTSIYYESTGTGKPALLFAHGWIGNCRWWDGARDALQVDYQVVTLDLGGHGKSGRERQAYSVRSYAEDIVAVTETLKLERLVLIGHSMSGSNVVEACTLMPERVEKIVLVDTLHDLEQMPSAEGSESFFAALRADYRGTVEKAFPQFLFAPNSPAAVVARVIAEALTYDVEHSLPLLQPFYATDIRAAAKRVKVPVRAVQGDLQPTHDEANRKYFRDFSHVEMSGTGHYPMLERPEAFVSKLRISLRA